MTVVRIIIIIIIIILPDSHTRQHSVNEGAQNVRDGRESFFA